MIHENKYITVYTLWWKFLQFPLLSTVQNSKSYYLYICDMYLHMFVLVFIQLQFLILASDKIVFYCRYRYVYRLSIITIISIITNYILQNLTKYILLNWILIKVTYLYFAHFQNMHYNYPYSYFHISHTYSKYFCPKKYIMHSFKRKNLKNSYNVHLLRKPLKTQKFIDCTKKLRVLVWLF